MEGKIHERIGKAAETARTVKFEHRCNSLEEETTAAVNLSEKVNSLKEGLCNFK